MSSKVDYDSSFYILKRILKEAIMPNILPFGIAILLMLVGSASVAYRAYLIKPAIDEVLLIKIQPHLLLFLCS